MSRGKNLFDVFQPIFKALNIVGFKFGVNRKMKKQPEGCSKRITRLTIFKMLSAAPLVSTLFTNITAYFSPNGLFTTIAFLSSFTYVFQVNEAGMRKLIVRLRSFQTLRDNKSIEKQLTFFKVGFTLGMTQAILTPLKPIFKNAMDNPHRIFDPFMITLLIPVVGMAAYAVSTVLLVIAIALPLCSLACLVAIYCTSRLDELVEEMKRSGSAVRRARLNLQLISHYRRLRQLASMTDPLTTHFVLNLKYVNMSRLIRSLYTFPRMRRLKKIDMLFNTFSTLLFTVFNLTNLMVYWRVTAHANYMKSIISRAQIDLILMDDNFRSLQPDTSIYLLRKKMNFLIQLNEILMDKKPFNSQMASVNNEGLFSFVAEFIDLLNFFTSKRTIRIFH